jgi:hypothetical protein
MLAVLLTVFGVAVLLEAKASGMSVGVASPLARQITIPAGTNSIEIPFSVSAIDEGRLSVQLRIPVLDARIKLVDPHGRTAVAADDRRMVVQRREETSRPELGALILLPEQFDPEPGIWRLIASYSPETTKTYALVSATLLERFQANLTAEPPRLSVGAETLLRLHVSDNGKPVDGLSPRIEVRLGDRVTGVLEATPDLRAASGVRLYQENGVYLARYRAVEAGHIGFAARLQLSGRRGPVIKVVSAAIDTGQSDVAIDGVRSEVKRSSAGCVESLGFRVDLTVPRAGTYTVTLVLEGSDARLPLRASQRGDRAGPLSFSIPLRSDVSGRFSADQDLTRISSVDVLRFDNAAVTQQAHLGPLQTLPAIRRGDLCR